MANGSVKIVATGLMVAMTALSALGATAPAAGATAPAAAVQNEPAAAPDPLDLRSVGRDIATGKVDEAALLKAQRGALDGLKKSLGVQFKLTETDHFLIFSDAAPAVTDRYVYACEWVHAALCKQFEVDPADKAWRGKCAVLVFADAAKYEDRAKRFDRRPAEFRADATAAYRMAPPDDSGPPVAWMCFSPAASDSGALIHLEAGFFLSGHTRPRSPPVWLNRGVALVVQVASQPSLRTELMNDAAAAAKAGTPLVPFLQNVKTFPNARQDAAMAYSVTDMILGIDRSKFKAVLHAVRLDMPFEDAFKSAYGMTYADLERRWRTSVQTAAVQAPATVPTALVPRVIPNSRPDQRPDQIFFGPSAKDPLLRLQGNWRAADGSINQAAFTTAQRATREGLNQALGVNLRQVETPRFLIFSNADASMTDSFVQGCDRLYANLCKQFDFSPADRVWDGKCYVLVFQDPTKYEERAKQFDGFEAAFSARENPAYCHVVASPTGSPRMATMCFSTGRRDPNAIVHEATHIFFRAYTFPAKLPLWLNEGVAVFMEVVNQPDMRNAFMPTAARYARTGSLSSLYTISKPADFKSDHYCVAYSAVDYLVTSSRAKFKAFVQGIKEGKSADDALKAAYGCGLTELDVRWRDWVARTEGGVSVSPSAPPTKPKGPSPSGVFTIK
jgi:hypothetical protein